MGRNKGQTQSEVWGEDHSLQGEMGNENGARKSKIRLATSHPHIQRGEREGGRESLAA